MAQDGFLADFAKMQAKRTDRRRTRGHRSHWSIVMRAKRAACKVIPNSPGRRDINRQLLILGCCDVQVPPIDSQIVAFLCQNRLIERTDLEHAQAFDLFSGPLHLLPGLIDGDFRVSIKINRQIMGVAIQ